MAEDDGRVVSNFIKQALHGDKITVYGSGEQTRSFQFVHDLVNGLIALMESNYTQPVNVGNPEEFTIGQFVRFPAVFSLFSATNQMLTCVPRPK